MAARTLNVRAAGALALIPLTLLLGACPDDATVSDADTADAVEDTASGDDVVGDSVAGDSEGADGEDTSTSTVPAHCPLIAGEAKAARRPNLTVRIISGEAGETLVAECGSSQIRVTALADGVMRVLRGSGDLDETRRWALHGPPAAAGTTWDGPTVDGYALCTPELAVAVRDGCALRVMDSSGEVIVDAAALSVVGDEIVADYAAPAGDRFYGFGEHQGAFDRRGTTMVHWNTDAYDSSYGGYAPDTDPLYLGVPFFVGLRDGEAYGVLFDDSHRLELDMADSQPDTWTLRTHADYVDQYVIAGPEIPEVVRRYTSLSGRTPLPPRWSLGFHQCRWGYSPDTAFAAVGAELRDRQIPADGLWLDIQHMDGYRTFSWDPTAFSDPEGLVSGLAADGFKTIVISDPGIKRDPGWDVYDRGLAADAYLKKPDGSTFTGVVWPGESVFPDFTLPAARDWWAAEVKTNALRGLRGVWLDVNEPTVFPESGGGASVDNDVVVAGDGRPTTMAELHNAYALFEAQATFEGQLAAYPDRRPFTLSRAGFSGSSATPPSGPGTRRPPGPRSSRPCRCC